MLIAVVDEVTAPTALDPIRAPLPIWISERPLGMK
jgi:hypothetical protein